MRRHSRFALVAALVLSCPGLALAQATVTYRLSFPEPEHRWMQVDMALADVPAGPLELHMSRSSPGRYALHEFAKNVYDVRISGAQGEALVASRPTPHQWQVSEHGARVNVRYRVFGDRIDGTYLAIDATHAHINMPAALMWARGFERRDIAVVFEPPPGAKWQVATQLFPGPDPLTFTAPNLQYLMDSPSEFSGFTLKTFTIADGSRAPVFRIAAHHDGSDADVEALARDAEKIVREARNVFGEFAPFDGNSYTFIADYLPWANGDGMEHRNSTIVTSASSIRGNRAGLIDTMSHEFFHSWNVERIRPKSLEPFNFDESNISGELWLAEGFTNYYGPLVLKRAGLITLAGFTSEMGPMISTVINSPARRVRTAEEMSQFAPFVDAAAAIDRTNFDNTFISYYTWGGALGIGLDLTLRERSDGRVTLDHLMRALWEAYGKPGGASVGIVDRPYTIADVKRTLATVSGDASFADDFFARYIQGHDVLDYQRLLAKAGLTLRPVVRGRAYMGPLRLQDAGGRVRVVGPALVASPAYAAGLDRDDVIVSLGGTQTDSTQDIEEMLRKSQPGTELALVFERRGRRVTSSIKLTEDPGVELVAAEDAGQTVTDAQKRFREAWLRAGS